MLGYPDSNQEKQDQNLLCYHYTISQYDIQLKKSHLRVLGYPDSNQEKQDQNLLCYHYTISQYYVLHLDCDALASQMRCKGITFYVTNKAF